MPLDLTKLERVRPCGERTRARCPACAELGHDAKGEHLSIATSGRFGCAAHAGDQAHRRRIWALAGDGGKLPAYVAVCRPVVLRNKWKSPDGSDGSFPVLAIQRPVPVKISDASDGTFSPSAVLSTAPSRGVSSQHPSEASEKRPTATAPASPRPPLVPLECPWREGERYREAVACEVASWLDLYIADPAGPWVRRFGTLSAVRPSYTDFPPAA